MKLFKQTLKVSAIGAIAATLAFGMMDAKAETAGTFITATVNNTIGFAETQPLSFGTFAVLNDATDTSTIVIQPDGTNTVNNPGASRIVALTPGVQGIFDVTAAAPSTALTLTIPTGTIVLNCGACTGSNPDFDVATFTSTPAVGALTTDGSGNATINVGATLTTQNDPNPYENGTYQGAYSVTVSY